MNTRRNLVILLAMTACAGVGFYAGRQGTAPPVRKGTAKVVPAVKEAAPAAKEVETPAAAGDSNVRWVDGENGTRMVYELGPDKKWLNKRVLRPDGATEHTASYRLDAKGQILGCKIGDADGKPLYKVLYGYRKSDGKLVEERILDDVKGKPERPEQVVCRVFYVTDKNGAKRAPVILGRAKEQEGQQLVGIPSALFENPFADRF